MASNNTEHSRPIPINTTRRGRSHSVSESSSSESSSPSSPVSPLQSPLSGTQPRVVGPISPGTSPILSYFLAQPPGKAPPAAAATFPFRRGGFGASALVDDDSESDSSTPLPSPAAHRRASTVWPGAADRFTQPPAPVPDHTDRAAGLLRRLSLGGSALRPPPPQIKTTGPAAPGVRTPPGSPPGERVARKTRRANTLAPGTARPKRAPSPMGERILTGHFDGFN